MNRIDLTEKNAVVTGGARGLGHAIAERLLRSGATVSLWDLDAEALPAAANALAPHGTVHTVVVDVTRAESVQSATETTLRSMGRIDILVNNAGIAGATKPLWEIAPEAWRQVIEIDLTGVFLCCRSVVP